MPNFKPKRRRRRAIGAKGKLANLKTTGTTNIYNEDDLIRCLEAMKKQKPIEHIPVYVNEKMKRAIIESGILKDSDFKRIKPTSQGRHRSEA